MLFEFERLRKAGAKFSTSALRVLARKLIEMPAKGKERVYHMGSPDARSDRLISEQINFRWVQLFRKSKNIVARSKTGKIMCSSGKLEMIEREVEYHLGSISRAFSRDVT